MPCSQTPAGGLRLALRTSSIRGELLFPAAFACGSSPLPVPQSAHLVRFSRCLAARRIVPACKNDEDPVPRLISGLNDTASAITVYASQAVSPRHHARLALGWWPILCRRA